LWLKLPENPGWVCSAAPLHTCHTWRFSGSGKHRARAAHDGKRCPINRTALIFGISGQDGSLLAQHLVAEGWTVHGTSRNLGIHDFRNLRRLGIVDRVTLHASDPAEFRSVMDVVARVAPAEIYNLSGQTSVGLSFDQPIETNNSILAATLNILEVIRHQDRRIRFFNAASSECFGNTPGDGADELAPFHPRSPYAVAKAAAYWTVANYREGHGLFAVSGITFNHESALRPEIFVTQKIIRGAARIARKEAAGPLQLGRLDVRRDWGWAAEYVRAMRLMLQRDTPEDFVIATGESHSLGEFAAEAFAAFGLDWEEHVVSDPGLARPTDILVSVGRPARARDRMNWEAKIRMREIVRRLAAEESARTLSQSGER
jgi:GDPmannose 4,6-dehydratase